METKEEIKLDITIMNDGSGGFVGFFEKFPHIVELGLTKEIVKRNLEKQLIKMVKQVKTNYSDVIK